MQATAVRRFCQIVCILSLFCAALPSCLAQTGGNAGASVSLCWDPSTDPDVVGYSIYWGLASATYLDMTNVDVVTNATVAGLIPGTTYYFAATALDSLGLESDFSNEVVYQVPLGCGIVFGNLTQVYNGTPISPTVTTSPPGLPVTLTYNQCANAPTAMGCYTVVATVASGNYAGSATNTLVVIRGLATITLGNLNQVYNGTAKSPSVSTIPSGLNVNLTYNGSIVPPINSGSYVVVGTINDPNYSGTATGTLAISKATGALTLGNLTQTYDGTAKSASTSTTPSGLAVNLTYNGSSSPAVNAGSYTVVGSITDSNYTGTATGTLAISKATGALTLGNLTQTYDGTAKSASASTTPSGLAVNLTYNGSSSPAVNAGSYTVVGSITDSNYTGTATGTLAISKATGTLTLGNLTQTYDGTAKSASASTTPSGLAVNLTYNGSSSPAVKAGSYTVVGSITDSNYSGTATGTLAISKATGTLTLGNLTQTYDGTAKSASASTTPSGLAVNLTYNGSSSPAVNAGSYTVVGSITDSNYTGTATGTLAISKATGALTLGNLTQTYDGTAKSASTSTTPSGLAVNFTYNGSSSPAVNAGSYTVVGSITDSNYTGHRHRHPRHFQGHGRPHPRQPNPDLRWHRQIRKRFNHSQRPGGQPHL